MEELNNMQITSNEISNTKYMQIYLTEEELKIQEIQYKIVVDFLKFIIDYKDAKDIEISIKELKLCNEEKNIIL